MTLNVHLQLPSEYFAALQQHVAETGGEIDAYVSEIVADSLQPEVEASRHKLTLQGTCGTGCNNGPTVISDLTMKSTSAASRFMRAVANEPLIDLGCPLCHMKPLASKSGILAVCDSASGQRKARSCDQQNRTGSVVC